MFDGGDTVPYDESFGVVDKNPNHSGHRREHREHWVFDFLCVPQCPLWLKLLTYAYRLP
jgi:hypothetical protein